MKQNKNVVRLTESQLKAMVAESVRKALKEAYSIPKNIDIYDDKKMGVIPYILKMANLYRDLLKKTDSLYDSAHAYYESSDNFNNDSSSKEEQQFKQYFWEQFDSMFETLSDRVNEAANELFYLEEEILMSINKHGSETSADYDERFGGDPQRPYYDYAEWKGYTHPYSQK